MIRLGAVLVGLALAVAAQASAAPKAKAAASQKLSPVTGAPAGVDWSGAWAAKATKESEWLPSLAPMTPEYKARYDRLKASMDAGHADFEPAANCEPLGMPRFMSNVYGMEIWHRAGALGIYGEYPGFFRHIWFGRDHPQDLDSTYYGDSVGHWEGKDLVVDTAGIKGNVLLSRDGVAMSDAASVAERFHQVDKDTLTDTIVLTDPKAFTRPWTVVKTYKRTPKVEPQEYFCTENNRHPTAADGTVLTILKSK